MAKIRFSYQEIPKIQTYIRKVYIEFARTLDEEEFNSAAWLAYWEAKVSYPRFQGCCDWETYLLHRLREAAQELKRQRNRRIALESQVSLDQPVGDGRNTVRDLVFPGKGISPGAPISGTTWNGWEMKNIRWSRASAGRIQTGRSCSSWTWRRRDFTS